MNWFAQTHTNKNKADRLNDMGDMCALNILSKTAFDKPHDLVKTNSSLTSLFTCKCTIFWNETIKNTMRHRDVREKSCSLCTKSDALRSVFQKLAVVMEPKQLEKYHKCESAKLEL